MTSIKRIIHVSVQDPNHMTGGQGVCILNICKAQMRIGFDIDYLSLQIAGEQVDQVYDYPEGLLSVHRFSVFDSDTILTPYSGTEEEQLMRREEFFHLVCQYIREHYVPQQSIIHLHGFYYVPLIAGALSEFDFVSTYHLLLSKRMERTQENEGISIDYLKMYEAISFYANKKIQAISPGMKSEILDIAALLNKPLFLNQALNLEEKLGINLHGLERGGVSNLNLDERIRIIPNGIGDEFFAPPQVKPKPNLVVAWGRISNEKGFEFLIDAARMLPDADFRIWGTTGDTERERLLYREVLEARARSVNNVKLDFRPKGVRGRELIESIDQAEIVVVPSLYEPFGLVIIEALARGKPVITTATAGGRFIMDSDTPAYLPHGYLIDKDPTKLSLEIVRALRHYFALKSGKCAFMRDAAKEKAESFRWTQIVKQIVNFYAD